jgi:hypothetical protein
MSPAGVGQAKSSSIVISIVKAKRGRLSGTFRHAFEPILKPNRVFTLKLARRPALAELSKPIPSAEAQTLS